MDYIISKSIKSEKPTKSANIHHMFLSDNRAVLPSVEHEIKLRRVSNGAQEIWFYVQSELLKLAASSKKNQTMLNNLQSIYNMTAELYRYSGIRSLKKDVVDVNNDVTITSARKRKKTNI